jgi:hypothetical protein
MIADKITDGCDCSIVWLSVQFHRSVEILFCFGGSWVNRWRGAYLNY